MNERETTLLSSILTATTGVAKTLIAVRDEQKQQSQRLDKLETMTERSQSDIEAIRERNEQIEMTLTKSLNDLDSNFKKAHDSLFDVMRTTFDEKLNTLVDVIASDDSAEEVTTKVEEFRREMLDTLNKNQENIEYKLNAMNQLKLMRTLIESLSTMQDDVSTLTDTILQNSEQFTELAESNRTMSARLDSVDLRFASFVGQTNETRETDEGLDTLNDMVRLLEQQQ
jgi:hypothetical protein